jgi:hypothetical protein
MVSVSKNHRATSPHEAKSRDKRGFRYPAIPIRIILQETRVAGWAHRCIANDRLSGKYGKALA